MNTSNFIKLSKLDQYKNIIRSDTRRKLHSLKYSLTEIENCMIRFEKNHIDYITRIPASDSVIPSEKQDKPFKSDT